jgi:hypothetical protein
MKDGREMEVDVEVEVDVVEVDVEVEVEVEMEDEDEEGWAEREEERKAHRVGFRWESKTTAAGAINWSDGLTSLNFSSIIYFSLVKLAASVHASEGGAEEES